MAETNQAIPLAPSRIHPTSDEEAQTHKTTNRRRRIKLCVCISTSLILLIVIVIVILAFTVFKVKDPKVTTNEITITNLNTQLTQFPTPQVKINMSMLVNMSIKNPNIASFKLGNSTATVYYRGVAVADAQIPPGLVKARKTTGMNVTAVVMADRLASNSDLLTDVMKGEMNMSAYLVIPGRVKILFIKKHAEVRMNCTIKVNISSREIQDLSCQRKVKL